MPTVTFPNGQTLTTSALSPDAIAALFQNWVLQMLGFSPSNADDPAWAMVRVGWSQDGQPAWKITEDVCIVTAVIDDDPYARVRDSNTSPRDAATITQNMARTEVWRVNLAFYGPNSGIHAVTVLSAVTFDWFHDQFAASNLYLIAAPDRPTYAPELFQKQWWRRADVHLRFNQLVTETTTVSTAAGVDVTVKTDTGQSETFHIGE